MKTFIYNEQDNIHIEESFDIIIKGIFHYYSILGFFKQGKINEWERDFYIDMINQFKLEDSTDFMSLKQKKRMYLINRKLGKRDDIIIKKVTILQEIKDAEYTHYFEL